MTPKKRPVLIEDALDCALAIILLCLFLLPFALLVKSLFFDPPPRNHTQHQPIETHAVQSSENPTEWADSLVCPD